jgi:nicotinate-nucleotide adenylyltransferase
MTGPLLRLHVSALKAAYRGNLPPPTIRSMLRSALQSFGTLHAHPPLALPGQRIGVMGGTFNPAHEGHLVCAETALQRLKLDALWWMVTPGNPLKSTSGLPSLEQRTAASRALISDPAIKVTGFEAELGSPYTYATVRYLRRRFPRTRFVWVMGADNLATFDRWQHWREIAGLVPLAVVDRPGWHLKALASPAARALFPYRLRESAAARLPFCRPPAWVLLTTRLSETSSTALRAQTTSL